MENTIPSAAVAEVPSQVPATTPSAWSPWPQRLALLGRSARLRLAFVAALLVLGVAAAFFFTRQPEWRVLFANVSDKDGGAIVAQLTQMNVPYRHAEGGGAILVPADRVHDVRLRLAAQGLPKGTVTGFELTESNRFGVTQFQERLNFQRGLEGELTRSIQTLDAVQSARVHLALPNQNGFFREQQKPSASVLLSLYPGRFLDRAQLAGIVHLVASSVPEMAVQAVSVVDDTGRLLSQPPDEASIDAQQLAYVQQIEQQYVRRIHDILEPVVGQNNVRAQVTVDVDFSHTESTVEQHRPNQSPDAAAVRSQQILETAGESAVQPPAGVPGAVSNQPPQNSSAPINGDNPPPGAVNGGAQQGGTPPGSQGKRESITNYEVDKTTRVTHGSRGSIRRVNAAVVVNDMVVPVLNAPSTGADAQGDTAAGSAADTAAVVAKAGTFTAEQLAQMTALVRESIGFDASRGDSVNLMNAPFVLPGADAKALPWWRQPQTLALAKNLGWPVGLSLAAALLLLGLIRPALKARAASLAARAAQPSSATRVDALEADNVERPALPAPAPTPQQKRLEEARVLARENPLAVANILKTWVNGD